MATSDLPVRLITRVDGLSYNDARQLANTATKVARQQAPKMSGAAAKRITPVYGKGYFGLTWQDSYLWYQEMGIGGFTMSALAGKTIPMWIDDPTGKEAQANPKAQTRTTKSGKHQVLIFRKAGTKGDKKRVKTGGTWTEVASTNYPGGPGRIALRQSKKPYTSPGKVGGQIAKTNVGVSWRHPGLAPRRFLLHGIEEAARRHHIELSSVIGVDRYGHEQHVSLGT